MSFWTLEVFEELASTSDYCIEKAKAGAPAGLAAMARRQTAGRGSRGRGWQAPEGNLNLSVLLRPALPAAQAGFFSLMAGVAVAKAVQMPVMLKWPNDIMLQGAKLAGILIDATPLGDQLDWLVIGIGVNVASAPELPDRKTTSLCAHGVFVRLEDLAAAILAQLWLWQGAPVPDVIETWLALAHPIGTPLVINGVKSGQFAGLSPHGELLLARAGQIETLNTGDVMLGQMGRER